MKRGGVQNLPRPFPGWKHVSNRPGSKPRTVIEKGGGSKTYPDRFPGGNTCQTALGQNPEQSLKRGGVKNLPRPFPWMELHGGSKPEWWLKHLPTEFPWDGRTRTQSMRASLPRFSPGWRSNTYPWMEQHGLNSAVLFSQVSFSKLVAF